MFAEHVDQGCPGGAVRAAVGEQFSAKDIRTWAGTLAAARALVEPPGPVSAPEAKRRVVTTVKAVAALLGNTAAVCRGSYIHPLVLDAFARDCILRGLDEIELTLTHMDEIRAFEAARIAANPWLGR